MNIPQTVNPAVPIEREATGSSSLRKLSLIIGVVGIAIAAFGFYSGITAGNDRPLLGWLVGVAFWLSVLIGMLFLVMISYVFDAGWSVVIRRQLEHAIGGFKILLLAFLPLLAVVWFHSDPGLIWKWLDPAYKLPSGETVAQDVLYKHKEIYLNKEFFTVRTLLFFGVFIGVAGLLRRHSFALDRDGDVRHVKAARVTSALGIFAVALATTFAAVDWFMSIEYHWFSTMYGVWYFSASMRAAVAMTIIGCFFLASRGHLRGIFRNSYNYEMGCIALAFTVFWAYISFSQYFLIYQANIPEETFWFNIREKNPDGALNSWWWVSMALIFAHFLFPFLFLLFYKNKVVVKRLLFISAWILVFHLADIYFNILPTKITNFDNPPLYYDVQQFGVTLWDVAIIVGLGGLLLWSFLRSAEKESPIPLRDPRILESLNHHE